MNKTSIANALDNATANQKLADAIASIGIPAKAPHKPRVLPKGTMAAISELKPTIVGSSFFDPTDTLEDYLGKEPLFLSRVMDSMCWMMDNSCINQARSVLFARYKDIDREAHENEYTFRDFCAGIAGELDMDSLYDNEDDESDTDERTLAVMLAVRKHWHQAAMSAASNDSRDYKPKTLRSLLEKEDDKVREVSSNPSYSELVTLVDIGTRANYQTMAKQEAGDDVLKATRLFEALVTTDALTTIERNVKARAVAPVVLEILRVVDRHADEAFRFDQLPSLVQAKFTRFAINTIDRCKTDMAKRMGKQPIAFARLAETAFQTTTALARVITAKYSDAGEMENMSTQGELDNERSNRRIACSID